MVVFGQKLLYSVNNYVIRAKRLVFGKALLYSGKSGCIRANMVVFGQDGCIR